MKRNTLLIFVGVISAASVTWSTAAVLNAHYPALYVMIVTPIFLWALGVLDELHEIRLELTSLREIRARESER